MCPLCTQSIHSPREKEKRCRAYDGSLVFGFYPALGFHWLENGAF
jgi:hypothetical protein